MIEFVKEAGMAFLWVLLRYLMGATLWKNVKAKNKPRKRLKK